MVRLNRNHKNDNSSTIEITPLVDVVFLLLIFFLLTATYFHPSMDLTLPEAESATHQEHEDPITIAISEYGEIEINNVSATLEDIARIPINSPVLILEDKTGPYGIFIEVLDTLRISGIEKISIVTDEKTE